MSVKMETPNYITEVKNIGQINEENSKETLKGVNFQE